MEIKLECRVHKIKLECRRNFFTSKSMNYSHHSRLLLGNEKYAKF